jgi:prevent-host-death family protein
LFGELIREIDIHEFKSNFAACMEDVRKNRRPIRITLEGRPLAEIVPVAPVRECAAWIGSLKDSAKLIGDNVSPADEPSDWESHLD